MAADRSTNSYLETIKRLEPDITMVDVPAAAASIAISLKRIADNLDKLYYTLDKGKL